MRDRRIRTITKSITWQVMGLVVMTLIGYVLTGSLSAGGGIAVSGAVTGFLGYMLHEAIWDRIVWGREGGDRTGQGAGPAV